MAENKGIVPNNNEHHDSTVDTQQVQRLEDSDKIANGHSKFIKTVLKNQMKILEKLDSIQKEREARKRKLCDQEIENPAKRTDTSIVVLEPSKVSLENPFKFVIRNVFKEVSKMEENKIYFSETEEHFGVPWRLYIRRKNGHLATFLQCANENVEKWSVDAECCLKIVHPNGKSVTKNMRYTFVDRSGRGYEEYIEWEDLLKNYSMNDKLIVEAHLNIKMMSGSYKDNLRSFDETMNDVSDVTLIIQDEKFRVSKMYLATHSSYFKTLFLGGFNESEQSEVVLTGIDSYDFQKYLEVVYGELAIDEYAVEGILHVADMYDTPIVVRKCEKFLLKKTKKTMKKKLQMSIRYNLNKLKEKCLSEIKTSEDIQSVIPGDINDLEPSLMAALLGKALTLL